MNLSKVLNDYVKQDYLPMHMPGHKRNPDFIESKFQTDITEIEGFDNFHNPTGLIKKVSDKVKTIFQSDDAYISVNGATGLILTSILAASASNKSGKAIVAGNCHISVWRALELARITPIIIMPDIHSSGLFYDQVSPLKIKEALDNNPDVAFVVLTSPTYEGIVSDTKTIYELTNDKHIPLIVDEAHGAHFGLSEFFPCEATADIVIKSIHKTLNAPTSTAIMLTWEDKVSSDMIKHYLSLTTTTSPSYILMSGINDAVNTISTTPSTIEDWSLRTYTIHNNWADKFTHFTLLNQSNDNYDVSKLVFLTNGYMTGYELSSLLHDKYKIDIEAAFDGHIIAMTGIGDTIVSLTRFIEAMYDIDLNLNSKIEESVKPVFPSILNPEFVSNFDDAIKSKSELVPIAMAEGRISAEYLFAYPPGIPILFPGQRINIATFKSIAKMEQNKASIVTDPRRNYSGEIRVKVDI